MVDIQWLSAYLFLGSIVGFFAGLLGLGGGAIMVPALTTLFITQGFPLDKVIHIALATSMSVIIASSLGSLRAHQTQKAVLWPIVWRMLPGLLIGTFGFTFMISYFSMHVLGAIFSCVLALIAAQMFFNICPRGAAKPPGRLGLAAVGMGIGGVSALLSVGGGSLGMPFLTWCDVQAQKAVATSAAIGLLIALTGTTGYLMSGLTVTGLPAHSIGYIYWPATISISLASFLAAPYGARLTHTLPANTVKNIFAVTLLLLSTKMFYTILTT